MTNSLLKVVIPMAGLGTRLRPHTWSKPKQLVSVAGKAVLDHVLESLSSLPDHNHIELIGIVGYLGDQVEEHVKEHYPKLKTHYVAQDNPLGQSHAIMQAREYLSGPMLVVFADTLIKTDLSFLKDETAEAVAWVKPVPDPRRFGVAKMGKEGWVTRLVEKPQDMKNNLALVGFYYFKHAENLLAAIDEQIARGITLKGEYFLADAINIMLKQGLKMRTQLVDLWLDAGTPEALLEMNRYLLDDSPNGKNVQPRPEVVIIPPVCIHHTAIVEKSVIGPYVSIGASCKVENSIIRDSILEDGAETADIVLENSLVGRLAQLRRRPATVNAGDNTAVTF